MPRPASLRSWLTWLAAGAALAGCGLALFGRSFPTDAHVPFILLAGALTAVGAVFLLWHVDPAWSISGAIGLSIFNGNWDELGVPGGFGLAPDRVILALGILALLVRAPGARDRPKIEAGPAQWALLLAACYAIASAIWVGTLVDATGLFLLLDRFTLVGFVAFAVAPLAFRTKRQRAIMMTTMVVTGAYLGFTAFAEAIEAKALVFPKYILDPNVGFHPERARGPFVEAEANGLALFACGVAAVIAAGTWRRRAAKVAAAAVALLCVAGCLFTLSRAIWIGTVLGLLVVMIAFREYRRFLVPVLTAGVLLVGGAFALIPGLYDKAQAREQSQRPLWARQNTNGAAMRMVEEKPLFGFGWSRFKEDSLPYFWQIDGVPLTGREAGVHNVILSNAAELGLIGATLWLIAVLLAIGGALARRVPPALRAWQVGLAAVAVQFAVVLNLTPLVQVFPNVLLFVWAGLVLAKQPEPVLDVPPPFGEVGVVREAQRAAAASAAG